MTFEEYVAHLNGLAFWKEFTFSDNKFAPRPGEELELADNLVWLRDHAYVIQLKEREKPTTDPNAERTWFQKKVLGTATRQIRDTLRFLKEHRQIRITNERGDAFDIQCSDLKEITKVVVFFPGGSLPEDCCHTRFHVSKTAGYIHIVTADDYLGILETLRVPEDIRRYFNFRQDVTLKLSELDVQEQDIVGAFLYEEAIPTPKSRQHLSRFVQDLSDFDLSDLIENLHNHLQHSERPQEYYEIMLEFARVPRSVWREIKLRFAKSLELSGKMEFARPFRVTFPSTGCTFMIAPLDPQLPSTGQAGENIRLTGLQNLTYAAMYDAKTSKGVGILISRDGTHIQLDWCLITIPWKHDAEMDARLADFNPFREAKPKMINSFLFAAQAP